MVINVIIVMILKMISICNIVVLMLFIDRLVMMMLCLFWFGVVSIWYWFRLLRFRVSGVWLLVICFSWDWLVDVNVVCELLLVRYLVVIVVLLLIIVVIILVGWFGVLRNFGLGFDWM